jgi:hypothetical protein
MHISITYTFIQNSMSAPRDRAGSLARSNSYKRKYPPICYIALPQVGLRIEKKDFVWDSYETVNVNCTCKICREKGTVNQMCAVLNNVKCAVMNG